MPTTFHRSAWAVRAQLLVLPWVVTIAAAACGSDSPEEPGGAAATDGGTPSTSASASPTVMGASGSGFLSVREIQQGASTYRGKQVTVAGDLGAAIAPHVAILDGRLYGTEDVILVTRDAAPGAFPVRAPVRGTGVLDEFDRARAEEHARASLGDAVEQYDGDLALYVEEMHFFLSGLNLRQTAIDLVGRTVTVSTYVTEPFGPRLLGVAGGAAANVDMVVTGTDLERFGDGARIEATGTVELATESALRSAAADLSDDAIERLRGLPMLTATEATSPSP